MIEKKFRRGAFSLGPLVQKLTKPIFQKRGLNEAKLILNWDTIIGKPWCDQTLPIKIRFTKDQRHHGTLYLKIDTSIALLFQHGQDVLLEKINGFFGYPAIAKIHLQQVPYFIKNKPSGKKPVHSDLPEGQKTKISHMTENIQHDDLKKALENFGHAVLASKK